MGATIRREEPGDAASIYIVHCAAFPTDAEARLVDRLRDGGKATVSLIAEVGSKLVGHVLFSPVTAAGPPASKDGLGLAPVAVLPDYQSCGIGAMLIQHGLSACREASYGFVVVLGHPGYYPRFGFRPASDFGISNEYGADEAFMVIELAEGSLPPKGSLIKYAPEFAELSD